VQAIAPVGPVRFPTDVVFRKDEIHELCATLALAELVLTQLGRAIEAACVAAAFEIVESRLFA